MTLLTETPMPPPESWWRSRTMRRFRRNRLAMVGVALIVPREGSNVGTEELRALVAGRLARFKVPRHLLFLDANEIPTTASGRARKFLLSQQAIKMLDAA